MALYLTALPTNLGFTNLGTVQAYPTGGTGPTAYGPTSYFGSDPLPSRPGDSVNNPINLGDLSSFSSISKSLTISNSHGGLTRIQTTFYKMRLLQARAVQFTQNFSQTSYDSKTNRNTILSFYVIEDGTHRRELPINSNGYVYDMSGVPYSDSDTDIVESQTKDYPSIMLAPKDYLFLITNDIRYIETTYSIGLITSINDWRYSDETSEKDINFDSITAAVDLKFDFGDVT